MAAPNILDRLIAYVSPTAGLRRAQTRAFMAANPRNAPRPRGAGASANADVQMGARALREHARHLRDNVGYIGAGLGERVDSAIGTGVVRKWSGPHADKLAKLHKAWSAQCDAAGKLNLGGVEALAMYTMECDGTALIRIRPRRADDGLAVPVQLQMLESDWVDTSQTAASATGNTVINGVEYDSLGRRVGWWLYDQHPGDAGLTGSLTSRTTSTLVPAGSIIDLYDVTRPGQGAGVSRMKSAILLIRDLELYREAEARRKDTEARIGIVASGDVQAMAGPSTGKDAAVSALSLGEIPSGGILQVAPGLNLTSVAPTAMPGYVDTIKYEIKLICAAIGCTYEGATGDMSEVNFSASRMRRISFRASIERTQWLTLVPQLLRPLDEAFVRFAKLAGALPVSAAWDVEYTFPRWPAVDQLKEVNADLQEIAGGMSSISAKIRERGNDPDLVFAERAADFKRLESAGLMPLMLALLKGLPMPNPGQD
ncbi:MAG: Stenotrophomonas phage, partial [Pseudomonadota bacterium]